ncbi:DUF6092 family protein [Streptomyces sp. CT34]|uniref:DUF6092 family protein n=1 Tax=Streptomyces sp. CT34 TaxID=1553907 RepID=UPI0005BB5835|nr:DUF6092 family protein [Streptomyces sp. CT34]
MTRGTGELRRTGEELLLLATFLLSSGRGLPDEPPSYGPLRRLNAARRSLALATAAGITNQGLEYVRAELEDFTCGAMKDRDLKGFLDSLCARLARLLQEEGLIARD